MKSHMQNVSRLALSLALIGTLAWLYAGDLKPPSGRIAPTMKTLVEVEPRRAVQSLSGDDEAVHVITESGSYYLTDNIIGEPGKVGIKIDADDVTLDLAGFALVGVEGSLHGIRPFGVHFNATIKNGSVRNWGSDGVATLFTPDDFHILRNARIVGITSHGNGGRGISGSIGTIQDCTVDENGSSGILMTQGTIENCTAILNGGDGIFGSDGAVIRGCVVADNEGKGIRAESSHVVHCTVLRNHEVGIDAGSRSTVLECTVRGNHLGGITVSSQCYVLDNNCKGNTAFGGSSVGIRALGNWNRIEGNDVAQSVTGIAVEGSSNIIVRNSSALNDSAGFVIADGNTFGPIVGAAGAGDISAVANANHPWANFEY